MGFLNGVVTYPKVFSSLFEKKAFFALKKEPEDFMNRLIKEDP